MLREVAEYMMGHVIKRARYDNRIRVSFECITVNEHASYVQKQMLQITVFPPFKTPWNGKTNDGSQSRQTANFDITD